MSSLSLLEIPASDSDRAAWLERQLVSSDLGGFVQQLQFVIEHGSSGTSSRSGDDLDSLLGDRRDDVLRHGLKVLGDQRLHALLQNPESLLSLQELVLVHGSSYWIDLSNRQDNGISNKVVTLATTPEVRKQDSKKVSRQIFITILTIAASVLLVAGIAINRSQPEPLNQWGFADPDFLVSEATPADYLQSLAKAANQWFDKAPLDSESLAKRLAEFSEGCATLIAAKHEPLNDPQRDWLIEQCQGWKGEIDRLNARVVAQQVDNETATAEADELVTRIVATLKAKGQQVARENFTRNENARRLKMS